MKKLCLLVGAGMLCMATNAQNKLTPEKLWQLGRVSALGLTKDKQFVLYSVAIPNMDENKSKRKSYGGHGNQNKQTGLLLSRVQLQYR